jgi:hypothetical protein
MFNTWRFNSVVFDASDAPTSTNNYLVIASSKPSINRGLKMQLVKLNEATASHRRIPFDMIQTTDYLSPGTGLTFAVSDIKVRAEGGSEADSAGTVTEIGGGLYEYELAASEVAALGKVTIRVVKTGMITYKAVAQVVGFDPYDSVRLGITSLPNAAASAVGGIVTIGTGAGQVSVDSAGGIYIALSQSVPATDLSSKTAQTVGDCLSAARAEGAGKWAMTGTVITIYGPDGAQVVRTFNLDSASNPTTRT